jgi:hypothetical protein
VNERELRLEQTIPLYIKSFHHRKRSRAMEYVVGIALAICLAATFIGFDRDRAFYPTLLLVIERRSLCGRHGHRSISEPDPIEHLQPLPI